MKLQDQDIFVGDKVYDLIEGFGTVTHVLDIEVVVRFSSTSSYSYNEAGKRTGNTPNRFPVFLFWNNPVFMLPLKDDDKWDMAKDLLRNMYETLKRN